MSKYVIERAMPGAGQLSRAELRAPEAIHEHARLAGLPVDAVHQIGSVIDPSTGDK
jgi:hypothetical protein